MKILIAANLASIHTIKWVHALNERGIELVLFGLTDFDKEKYKDINNLKIYSAKSSEKLHKSESKLRKLTFVFTVRKLKKILKIEKPDILHAHYASSYGYICALTKYKPLIVSVWGSDIYSFPHSSFITKKIITYTLSKATRIFSTSNDMAREANLYTDKKIDVTPFGVDTSIFKNSGKRLFFSKDYIVIGTVKNLEINSGIDYLLKAFSLLKDKQFNKPVKLVIIGDGAESENLKNFAKNLNIANDVIFTGKVDYNKIVDCFSSFDIYAVPSLFESFGVAVLEASACEVPVVATNAGGLPEVVVDNITGFIVPKADEKQFSLALSKLIENEQLRISFGKNARNFTIEKYDWNKNVEDMIELYKECLSSAQAS